MRRKYDKCTTSTVGTVVKVNRYLDYPDRAYIRYMVGNTWYTLKENLTCKSSLIKIKGIPIGQRKIHLTPVEVGDSVTVLYDPNKPQKSHLQGNDGKFC